MITLSDALSFTTAEDGRALAVANQQGYLSPDVTIRPSASFAAALSEAIEYTHTSGGYVNLVGGQDYELQSGVVVTDRHVRIRFNGARIFRSTVMPNASALAIFNTFSSAQIVTALDIVPLTFVENTTMVHRISVEDSSGWSVGQYGRIVSDDLLPWAIPAQAQKCADSFRVAAVEPGYIYTYSLIRVPLTKNIRVARYSEFDCEIHDWRSEDAPGSPASRNTPQFLVRGAVKPKLYRPIVKNSLSEGLNFSSCLEAHTLNAYGENMRTSSPNAAYGYLIREQGCVDGYHVGVSGARLRHGYTTSAYIGLADNDARFDRYGGVIAARVHAGHGVGAEHNFFDCHDDALEVVFSACSNGKNYKGSQGSQTAIKLRGKRCKAINCTTYGMQAVRFETTSPEAGDFVVHGHHHTLPAGYSAVEVFSGSHYGPGRTKASIDAKINADTHVGTLMSYDKMDVTLGLLDVAWQFTGEGTARFLALEDASVSGRELRIDLSAGTGTSPKIIRFDDDLSTFSVEKLSIRAGGIDYYLADFFSGQASSATFPRVECDRAPGAGGNGFLNVGASSVYWANVVANDGVGPQPASLVSNLTLTYPLTTSLAGRGEDVIVVQVRAQSVTAATRELTISGAPVRERQQLIVVAQSGNNQPVVLKSSPTLALSSDKTLAARDVATFIGLSGIWVETR